MRFCYNIQQYISIITKCISGILNKCISKMSIEYISIIAKVVFVPNAPHVTQNKIQALYIRGRVVRSVYSRSKCLGFYPHCFVEVFGKLLILQCLCPSNSRGYLVECKTNLTLTVLVVTIDAQWEGMGDVGSARYKPALLPPCPTIRVLSYSK